MKDRVKSLLKKLQIYHPLQSSYRSGLRFTANQYYRATYAKYHGHGYICNFCGARYGRFVPEYPAPDIEETLRINHVIAGYGPNVYCPNCLSKNRERLVKAVIQHYLKIEGKQVLHFSPEKRLYRWLKKRALMTTVDIAPGFYMNIDSSIKYADATQLPFADGSFSLIIANHILEHIPEDSKAIKEMWRVLKNDGVALLQVPYSATLPTTMEEPYINDPARQAALYGKKDHVRIYAMKDYINRLEKAGFRVSVLTPEALVSFRAHAIQEDESVFLCYK